MAAILVLEGFFLSGAAETDGLVLALPDRTTTLQVLRHARFPSLRLESLARAFEARVQNGPDGWVELRWDQGILRFTPNHRQVRTSQGTAMLPAPPRRRGPVLWLPVEAALLAARERFGADRVRWDPSTRMLTVAAWAPEVRAIRVGSHPDRTRVVLEASRPVDWAVTGEGDGRLVVALPGSAMSQAIVRREYHVGTLRIIEPIPGPTGAQVRLTFAGRTDRARWFALQEPFRIVVDLYGAALVPSPASPGPSSPAYGTANGHAGPATPRPEPEPSLGSAIGAVGVPREVVGAASGDGALSPAPVFDVATPLAPKNSAAPAAAADAPPPPARGGALTIVIDPGHGGKDTGAIGPRGLKEKDVVLDIGLRLRRLLIDRLGARVIMTRSEDTFVGLEERTAIANRARADFFISIHVNAAPQARASGVETYYLSREPSDISARASAARENLVLNLEGVSPGEQDSLKAVLWDMAETLHLQESSAMAEMLLEDLGRALRVETRGVKHGPFVVLLTAGMPSALVEVAFISNPNQERRLQADAYRHSIALALSEGIERFAHRYQRRIGMQPPRPGPS